jgi:hypothetical protein
MMYKGAEKAGVRECVWMTTQEMRSFPEDSSSKI